MPRLLGLDVSGASLALRVVLGIVFGGLALGLLYYIPANLGSMLSSYLPASTKAVATGVVSSLLSPSLPPIGLVAAALIFLGVLLRGTRVYGVILLANGLVFVAYVYTLFQGGTITLSLPSGLPSSLSGSLSLNVGSLMLIFLIAPILTVVKGIVLTVTKPAPDQGPAV